MKWQLKTVIGIHIIGALMVSTFGVLYMFHDQFMPYHSVAIGKSWEQVDPHLQTLLLALMRVAAGGFFAAGAAICAITICAIRKGARWALWSVPVVELLSCGGSFLGTIMVATGTPASPPWQAAAAGMGVIALGIMFTLLIPGESST